MAKHMREPQSTRTNQMPRATHTRVRTTQTRRHVPNDDFAPYGQVASYRAATDEPVLRRDFYWGEEPARGGVYAFARGIFLLIAWAFRLLAFVAVLFVLLNALSLPVFRTTLAQATELVTSYMPWQSLGLLAIDTPFGGVFRGDMAILALLFFEFDWLFCRFRANLR